jgi:hypothetical protein
MNSRRRIASPKSSRAIVAVQASLPEGGNVRFGSKADMTFRSADVPFTSKADIEATQTDVCFVPIADILPICSLAFSRSHESLSEASLGAGARSLGFTPHAPIADRAQNQT